MQIHTLVDFGKQVGVIPGAEILIKRKNKKGTRKTTKKKQQKEKKKKGKGKGKGRGGASCDQEEKPKEQPSLADLVDEARAKATAEEAKKKAIDTKNTDLERLRRQGPPRRAVMAKFYIIVNLADPLILGFPEML